jgi:FRG domain
VNKSKVPLAGADSEKAWAEFIAEISKARSQVDCPEGGGCEPWYRGQRRLDFKLLPSLYRGFADLKKPEVQRTAFGKESDLFWEFAARARELHGVIEEDWDILFAMQHYGTPTRLLDWTEVLSVAVYFAVLAIDAPASIDARGIWRDASGEEMLPPCVWVLNPYGLNASSGDRWVREGSAPDMVHPAYLGSNYKHHTNYTYGDLLTTGHMHWSKPVAIYPRQRNARMHAQRAWFTIHGDLPAPIEEIDGSPAFLRKVPLPFAAIPAAKRFLGQAGIDHYLLFSDLENLSLHLMEKNRLITREQAEKRLQQRLDRRDFAPGELLQKADRFLQWQSLDVAFRSIANIRAQLEAQPLPASLLEEILIRDDARQRVLGYVELQLRPKAQFLASLLAGFHLEYHLALTKKETRPLWQLLETLHRFSEKKPKCPASDRTEIERRVKECAEFLAQNPELDPGRECQQSIAALLTKL